MSDEEPKSVEEWTKTCHKAATDKGWHDPAKPRQFGTMIALMHSELTEALEEGRNGHAYAEVYFKDDGKGRQKPEGVPIELADLLYRVFDFAGLHGIDLQRALEIKHAYNIGREMRHGGKEF